MLQWFEDGIPLAAWQDGVTIETNDAYPTNISSILTIASLAAEDQGNYTCIVSNAAGNESYTALLIGK